MINKYIFYLNEYLINIPLYLIHELSHYIVAFFVVFLYRMDDIPKLEITRKPYIEYKNDCYCCYETSMCVSYTSIRYNIGDFFITLSPAVSTLIVLYIAFNINIWLFLFIISRLNKLWLSHSDIEQLKKYINERANSKN